MNRIYLYLKKFDWILFSAVILLACFGLMEIYSVALGREMTDLINFRKQIVFILLGTATLFVFTFIDYRSLRSFGKYLYAAAFVFLVSVILFGISIRGTRGWFDLGPVNIQPAEFAKIAMLIFLAGFFSNRAIKSRPFKQMLGSGLLTAAVSGLIFIQPDFGSALLIFLIWMIILMITGFSRKYFLILGVLLAVSSIILWSFLFQDYQRQRILTFIDPSADSLDQGYNINQAMIAVGAGGLTGRGLGFGSQSQLKFLPEAQNDFIFAVIAEELGFLGVAMVLILYALIFFRAIVSLKNIKDDFAIFFILGATGLIFMEMFINISMNIGILPVVGISLPFISYGGSSMVSSFMLIGIMENMIIRSKINY